MGLVADRLIADEDPRLDDRKLAGLDPVVIIAAGRQALGASAVAVEVDDVRPDAELAQLVGGEERRAGVIGLVAEGAIELGGMADRLVDRQRQMGGQEHKVLDARRDRGGREMRNRLLADPMGVCR